MASKTRIANMALSHLGQGLTIGSLETEKSEAANAINTFYETALDMILRKRDWSFARKTANLALVAKNPTSAWAYAFRYPTDCVMVRRDVSYQGSGTGAEAYSLGADSQGALIYSNSSLGTFTYTYRNTTTAFYPPDFVLALSYLLASLIAPRLTAGDPFKLGDRAAVNYLTALDQAAVNSYNEEARQAPAPSAFQTVRG